MTARGQGTRTGGTLLCVLVLAGAVAGQTGGAAVVGRSAKKTLRVAAAADMNPALREIASAFREESGGDVDITFGSSAQLFAQIENGAPFDVFLSADSSYPEKLVAGGLAAGPAAIYAQGQLALWVANDSAIQLDKLGMQALLDPSVRRIAIANPSHAPYGRAAVAALRRVDLYARISDRLVLGENVTQAAKFVQSGNAQIGIVALSVARSTAMRAAGRYWIVPADSYPAIIQAGVQLRSAPAEAAGFLKFLTRERAQAILHEYGFLAPRELSAAAAAAPAQSKPQAHSKRSAKKRR